MVAAVAAAVVGAFGGHGGDCDCGDVLAAAVAILRAISMLGS